MSFNKNKVLLICPRFFGYEERIVDALKLAEWDVDYFDERPSNSVVYKALNRLGFGFMFKKYTYNYYYNILQKLSENSYTFIFFVNIESTNSEILSLFEMFFPKTKKVLYMWDSSANKPKYLELLDKFDKVFSFDNEDVKLYPKINYLPLFYTDKKPVTDKTIDISFVGTVHNDRLKVLLPLVEQCSQLGLNTYFYFYYPSKIIFWLRFIYERDIPISVLSQLNFVPLSYSDYLSVITSSKCVIDINHPKQSGVTMRTIEVLSAGAKVVTTNESVALLGGDIEKNIYILDRKNPNMPEGFIDSEFVGDFTRFHISKWVENVTNCL